MPSIATIIRQRKARAERSRGIRILGSMAVGIITCFLLLFFAATFTLGLIYVELTKDLPSVGNIELLYSQGAAGFVGPIQVHDRTGEKLFDLIHPRATDRRWMELSGPGRDVIPAEVMDRFITLHDRGFWAREGIDLDEVVFSFVRDGFDLSALVIHRTIPQRLVAMTILPTEDFSDSPFKRYLRELILAHRLTGRYSKEQILEWYVNTVGFGPLTSGIDAAALVYYGKHAPELSLSESTALIGLSHLDGGGVWSNTFSVEERLERLAQRLVSSGLIDEHQGRSFALESLETNPTFSGASADLQHYTWHKLYELFGIEFLQRANLNVDTTIDYELQYQVGCMVDQYLMQLRNHIDPSDKDPTHEEVCGSTSIPEHILRGDLMLDEAHQEISSVVLDTKSGEILSYFGTADSSLPSGSMLYPFLYLTAFSKGNSPGSMVLDIPIEDQASHEILIEAGYEAQGPVRMRTALMRAYPFAAQRVIRSTGLEAILGVFEHMGVTDPFVEQPLESIDDGLESLNSSVLNLVFSYGVFANEGKMVGVSSSEDVGEHEEVILDPSLIRQVRENSWKVLYESSPHERSILSRGLAYLVTDVLIENAKRLYIEDEVGGVETSFSAAVMTDLNFNDNVGWTIGYTPSTALGLRIRDKNAESRSKASQNGMLELWAAILRQREINPSADGWEQPPEVNSIDVCDPSGLLPTEHCPRVVSEIYLDGTEPVYFDNFFQPLKVNPDTGKLATAFTPIDKVRELVFFIPPAEARDWMLKEGWMQPPTEYDTLQYLSDETDIVAIESPEAFDTMGGLRWISGRMEVENFHFFRLQYGRGLNPNYWYQIGEDRYDPVESGILALWDTGSLDGLYTLQLSVVDRDGVVHLASQYLTVDNHRPEVRFLQPEPVQEFSLSKVSEIGIEVSARDNIGISRVDFYSNQDRIALILEPPYSIRMPIMMTGVYEVHAKAYDVAGNVSEGKSITITVVE